MKSNSFPISNFQFPISNSEKGMTIVEMAVGIGLTVILGGALVSMGILAVKASNLARMKAKALRYAEEGIEVSRSTRDNVSSSSLELLFDECEGKNCCVSDEGLLYSSTAGGCTDPEELEGGIFARTITISRDSDNPDEKAHMEVEVSWENGKKSVKLETFLTAWRE